MPKWTELRQTGGTMIESHSLSEYLYGEAVKAEIDGEYKKALHYLEQVLIMNPGHRKAWCEKELCQSELERR